jgi:TetR/AcrR family transcriptional repressor of nem operon
MSISERGRPREFDIETVVAAAGRQFWEQGYHATSVEALCQATGLLRGSLYGAFGDKHGLLVAAFDYYADGAAARLREQLAAGPSPREALRNALLHYTRVAAQLSGRHGCLITNSALELLPSDEVLRPHIEAALRRVSGLLSTAFSQAQASGAFDPALTGDSVGTYLLCLIQGLRVLGKTDLSEAQLSGIVDMAMRALD